MGVVEAGCLAHARRKFYELWVNHQSAVAEQAPRFFTRLYDVERQLQELSVEERLQRRRCEAKPVADLLNAWLLQRRALVPSEARADVATCSTSSVPEPGRLRRTAREQIMQAAKESATLTWNRCPKR